MNMHLLDRADTNRLFVRYNELLELMGEPQLNGNDMDGGTS